MNLARKKLGSYILNRKLEEKGWRQTDLANELECTCSYISDLMNNHEKFPSIKFALKLERVTGIRPQDWGENED